VIFAGALAPKRDDGLAAVHVAIEAAPAVAGITIINIVHKAHACARNCWN
jgi:hypothetical protein